MYLIRFIDSLGDTDYMECKDEDLCLPDYDQCEDSVSYAKMPEIWTKIK